MAKPENTYDNQDISDYPLTNEQRIQKLLEKTNVPARILWENKWIPSFLDTQEPKLYFRKLTKLVAKTFPEIHDINQDNAMIIKLYCELQSIIQADRQHINDNVTILTRISDQGKPSRYEIGTRKLISDLKESVTFHQNRLTQLIDENPDNLGMLEEVEKHFRTQELMKRDKK